MRLLNKNNGFTLVELAIVMVIVGLLIGATLKGQEMIRNARATATIKQINAIQTAIIGFQDKYQQLPGDMRQAFERIPGCTAANFCVPGDGDSVIGRAAAIAINHDVTPLVLMKDQTTLEDPGFFPEILEVAQIWKHLALSEFISGIDVTVETGHMLAEAGTTNPASALGIGGVVIGRPTGSRSLTVTPYNGMVWGYHYLSFIGALVGPNAAFLEGGGAMSPRTGMIIDRKMDDGDSQDGAVILYSLFGSCSHHFPVLTDETSDNLDCVLWYPAGALAQFTLSAPEA